MTNSTEKKQNWNNNIILGLIIFIVFSVLYSFINTEKDSKNELIQEYYNTEVATNISAHGLRKKMLNPEKNFILVDVRSEEEYINEHIIWAINIPAYTNKDNSEHTSEARILEAFRMLWSDKEIITYCYSAYCMTSKKIGKFLAENWVYVKHLTVWWNEWRYHWNLWNYPHEKDETEKFIESWKNIGGIKIGVKSKNGWGCEIQWEFSC